MVGPSDVSKCLFDLLAGNDPHFDRSSHRGLNRLDQELTGATRAPSFGSIKRFHRKGRWMITIQQSTEKPEPRVQMKILGFLDAPIGEAVWTFHHDKPEPFAGGVNRKNALQA